MLRNKGTVPTPQSATYATFYMVLFGEYDVTLPVWIKINFEALCQIQNSCPFEMYYHHSRCLLPMRTLFRPAS